MENNLLLSPIPLDQLTGLLATIVRQEIQAAKEAEIQDQLLTKKEAAALLKETIKYFV